MESGGKKSWNSDVKVNPEARQLLDNFLTGRYDYNNPPSYQTLIKDYPSYKLYQENTIQKVIKQFAQRSSTVSLRRQLHSPESITNNNRTLTPLAFQDMLPDTNSKSKSIKLPVEIWTWSRKMMKHVTIRIQLLSHFDSLSHHNIQLQILNSGKKVLLRIKRHSLMESEQLVCQMTPTDPFLYSENHVKTAAFESYMKAQRQHSDEELWYEQIISLPIECQQQFYTGEKYAEKGFRAICLNGHNGHKEIEFELVEINSNWHRNLVEGRLHNIGKTSSEPDGKNADPMEECLNETFLYQELQSCQMMIKDLEHKLEMKEKELKEALEYDNDEIIQEFQKQVIIIDDLRAQLAQKNWKELADQEETAKKYEDIEKMATHFRIRYEEQQKSVLQKEQDLIHKDKLNGKLQAELVQKKLKEAAFTNDIEQYSRMKEETNKYCRQLEERLNAMTAELNTSTQAQKSFQKTINELTLMINQAKKEVENRDRIIEGLKAKVASNDVDTQEKIKDLNLKADLTEQQLSKKNEIIAYLEDEVNEKSEEKNLNKSGSQIATRSSTTRKTIARKRRKNSLALENNA